MWGERLSPRSASTRPDTRDTQSALMGLHKGNEEGVVESSVCPSPAPARVVLEAIGRRARAGVPLWNRAGDPPRIFGSSGVGPTDPDQTVGRDWSIRESVGVERSMLPTPSGELRSRQRGGWSSFGAGPLWTVAGGSEGRDVVDREAVGDRGDDAE